MTTPISSPDFEPVYVVDTHILLWSLVSPAKLNRQQSDVFEAARKKQTYLVIPSIVVAELFYLNQKRNYLGDFDRRYKQLKRLRYFEFVNFTADDALDFTRDSAVPEMHDRIIVGVAHRLNCPLLTIDSLIIGSKLIPTI